MELQCQSTLSGGQPVPSSRGGVTQGMSTHSGGQPVPPSRGGVTQGLSTRSGGQPVPPSRGGVTPGMSTRSGGQPVMPSRRVTGGTSTDKGGQPVTPSLGIVTQSTHPSHIHSSWKEIVDPAAELDRVYEGSTTPNLIFHYKLLFMMLTFYSFRCMSNNCQATSRSHRLRKWLVKKHHGEFCRRRNAGDVILTRFHFEATWQGLVKDAKTFIVPWS